MGAGLFKRCLGRLLRALGAARFPGRLPGCRREAGRPADAGPPAEPGDTCKLLGAEGERAAAACLKKHGHKILKRNYTCPRGELDIIALDGDVICFVEVKTRRPDALLDPARTVTAAKRRKVRRVARYYLRSRNMTGRVCRFDIASVIYPYEGEPQVELIENAF